MRNILKYPLTDQEIIEWLDRRMEEEQSSQRVGGMDMMIIQSLKDRVVKHPLEVDQPL